MFESCRAHDKKAPHIRGFRCRWRVAAVSARRLDDSKGPVDVGGLFFLQLYIVVVVLRLLADIADGVNAADGDLSTA